MAPSEEKRNVMASFLVGLGRFLFFALTVSQCFLLASYPAKYKENSYWYGVASSFAPSLIAWVVVLFKEAMLCRLFFVWGLSVRFWLSY